MCINKSAHKKKSLETYLTILVCGGKNETINDIISECSKLAQKVY